MKEKRLLSIEKASQKYKIPEPEIHSLIRDEQLPYYTLGDQELVAQDDIATVAAARLRRDQFHDLEGVPIGVSQAAIKYGFHVGTISQWVQERHIREIGPDPTHKLRRLINEADVAYAAAMRNLKGIRPGRGFWP
jgi:hypothetical protein